MTTHGGRRPGSGRKPKPSRKTSLTVQLPDELYAAMEAEKDRLSYSWPVLVQHMAIKAGIVPVCLLHALSPNPGQPGQSCCGEKPREGDTNMTEMDYSMVLFRGTDLVVSDLMPQPILSAFSALLTAHSIMIPAEFLTHSYDTGNFDYAVRFLHLPDGRIGMLMVGGETPIDARVFSDFLCDTEGFWADREYRFPCYHAKALQDTATFIGHISVQEACDEHSQPIHG